MSMIRAVGSVNYDKSYLQPFFQFVSNVQAGKNAAIQVVSDSTGDGASEWPYLLAEYLHAKYPYHYVKFHSWNDSNQNYDAPTIYGEDEFYYNVTGSEYLYIPGGDIPAMSGDLDFSIRLESSTWLPATNVYLFQKWVTTGNQRGFYVQLTTSGRLIYYWSPDGIIGTNYALSSVDVPNDGTIKGVRVIHDIDNGSSGNTVTFYTTTDGTTWQQLGTPVTTAGTTTIFNCTSDLKVALTPTATIIKIFEFDFKSNGSTIIGGPVTLFIPTTNVTAGGNNVICIFNASKGGANLAYWSDSNRIPKALLTYEHTACILNLIQNETTSVGATWKAAYAGYIDTLRANLPYAQMILLTSNPRLSTASYAYHVDRRIRASMTVAQEKNCSVIDTAYSFYTSSTSLSYLLDVDGVHPKTGTGATLMFETIRKALNDVKV